MLTVNPNSVVVERQLAQRSLTCSKCQVGVVRPYGWMLRYVRSDRGEEKRPSMRRGVCTARGCEATHVLLPYVLLARRLDEVELIGRALAARGAGQSWQGVAGLVGRPVSTVRGWWRRMAANAAVVRVAFTVALCAVERDGAAVLKPARHSVGDVVAVVAETAAAVRRFSGGAVRAGVWQVASALTGGGLLRPDPPKQILQHFRT